MIWWGLRWWAFLSLPNGSGLLGTGAILLGLNATRAGLKIPPKRQTTVLGVLALLAGGILLALELLNVHLEIPIFEAMLIPLGVALVIRVLMGWREAGIWRLS